jgi:hypothetical protein
MCALDVSRQVAQKKATKEAQEDRKKTREKLDAMRTKPQLVKVAQTAFNAFIRARDAGKPCISCEKPLGSEPNTYDAGHFRSVGSAPHMRFVDDNVHGQCKHCNNYLGGNVLAYRKGLIERIGLTRVEQIEADTTLRKYTHEGLREIATQYREMARRVNDKKIF